MINVATCVEVLHRTHPKRLQDRTFILLLNLFELPSLPWRYVAADVLVARSTLKQMRNLR